ncbi:MAG: hypothetical protein MI976_13005 [Pseudomonadales bacterium]|nr:hypothetical protein [Pseudomonadales bacterium]
MDFHGVRIIFVLLAFGMLTACTGGDGSGGTDSGNRDATSSVSEANGESSSQSQDSTKSTLQVRQFVADLQTWQGDLELAPEQASFNGVGEVAAKSATTEMTEMLQVIAVAGQQATIVALPDIFLSAACDQLSGLSKWTCNTLTNGQSLGSICNFALNIDLFGKPLCEWLSTMSFPIDISSAVAGNTIVNRFEILEGNAQVLGYDAESDTRMNLRLTESGHEDNEVFFAIDGTASQGGTELQIESGELRFQYDVLDGSKVVFPKAAQMVLQVAMSTSSSNDYDDSNGTNSNFAEFDGEISAAIVFEERKPLRELLGLENLSIAILANGLYSNSAGNAYPTRLRINNAQGPEYQITLEVQTNDLNTTADISFDSETTTVSEERLSFTMAWDNKSYEITRDPNNPQWVTVENQEKVSLFVDYGAADDNAGVISIDGKGMGEVTFLNGSLLITLIDGTELIL